jgi:hypothetical protein
VACMARQSCGAKRTHRFVNGYDAARLGGIHIRRVDDFDVPDYISRAPGATCRFPLCRGESVPGRLGASL